MGKSKPQVTTTETKLPEWLDNFAQENVKMAKDVAAKPFQRYTRPLVQEPNADMNASYDIARKNVGTTMPLLQGGYDTVTGATKINPQGLSVAETSKYLNPMTANSYGQSIESTDGLIRGGQEALGAAAGQDIREVNAQTMEDKLQNLGGYMNPYVDNVVNAASRNYQHQLEGNLNTINDRAASANAFGNSRRSVMQGAAAAENARLFGDFAAGQYSNAFNTAAGLAKSDVDNNFLMQRTNQATDLARQAQMASIGNTALSQGYAGQSLAQQGYRDAGQLANAQANNDLQRQQNLIAAGQAQANIGTEMQNNYMRDASLMNTFGNQQRELQQANLDAERREWEREQNYDLNNLNIRLAAAGMTPHGQTQTSTTTGGSSSSGLSTALGIGSMAASLLAAPFTGGTSLFGMAGGALAGLPNSDEKMKTDIKPAGKDEETGLPLYSYRYKGDPKTYPKVVGPMAQDIQKKYPDMVQKFGNGLTVNPNFGPMKRAFK